MTNKKSLKIGIDIDGTVTDPSSIVPFLNRSFGKNLTLQDCFEYNLANVYGITDEEFTTWLLQNSQEVYSHSLLHGNASEILQNWHFTHELIYISARALEDMQVTKAWFAKHHIPYDHINLVGSHDKVRAAKAWGIDLFMEDRLENALQLSSELNIPVLLFDTPYNQGELPSLVHRITNWDEAESFIRRLEVEHVLTLVEKQAL